MMDPLFERHDIEEGIVLHAATTSRFKSIAVKLRLLEPLDVRAATRSLLASMLRRGCVSAPDLMSVARRAENLFGASYSMDLGRIGETQVSDFSVQLAHPKFLDASETLEEALAFLRELVCEPVVEDGGLRAREFEQERENLLRAIRAIFDDKASWAHVRLIQIMFEGEPYARLDHGSIEEVAALDRRAVLAEHRRRLAVTPLHLFAIGDLSKVDLAAIERFARSFGPRHAATDGVGERAAPVVRPRTEVRPPREIIEPVLAAESHLLLGYRFDPTGLDRREQIAMSALAALLGGGAHSMLFKELREEAGLAYSTNSQLDRAKGLLVAYAGISRESFEQARDLVRELIERCGKGEFDHDSYGAAILSLKHSIRTALDSPGRAIEFAARAVATGWPPDPAVYGAVLSSLTPDDVVAAARRLHEDTCFLAAGRTDEGDLGSGETNG